MLYESMLYVGVGVLVVVGFLVVYVLAFVLIDAVHARRERREEQERAKRLQRADHEEDYKRYMRGLAVLLLVGLAGCNSGPTAPDTLTVAPPSPSPTAPPPTLCAQNGFLIRSRGFNADFHAGEYVTLEAFPSIGDSALEAASCPGNYAKRGTWSHFGTWCDFFGNTGARTIDFECYIAGNTTVRFCALDESRLCGDRTYRVLP